MHPFQFLASSLRNTTFRRQLSIMVGAGVMLLVLLSSLAISWQSSREIRLNREQQGQRLADSLARQSRLALLSDTGDNVADAMAGALAFPDVQQLEIRRPDGRALVAQSATGAALTMPAEVAPADALAAQDAFLEAQDSQSWRFVAVVRTAGSASPFETEVTQGQLLGYVRVVLSKASMQQAMLNLFALNMGISFFFALIFLAATRWITLRMTRPLGQLADSMGRAQQGQAGVRAEPSGPRDIVEMAHAFNSMMTVLDERDQSLRQAREEALQLARLKADFAATMSHELRTPLNGVVGTLDILRASALPPAARSYVNLAWDSSQYLLDLINNILDFSSLDAGKLRLTEGDFDLARLCEQSIDLVSPQVGSKGLEMAYMLAPGVPLNLRGDSRRLRQILLNLLGNAVKFTERGDIVIRVAPVGDFAHSGILRFEVVDSGMGVPVAAQATIFDSYTQADPSSTRSHDGSGLGLAICKQLCVLMGGEIGVDSEPGVGSTFWFTLPFKPGVGASPVPGRQRSGRVLVLDESAVVRQFLEQSLQACGYVCSEASKAQHASHLLLQAMQAGTPYQIVIVDMLLAQAHAALVQDLRTAPQFGRPRMVLMNRYGAVCEPDAPQADVYLAKPLRLERLLECLDTAMGARAAVQVALPQGDARVPRILVVEDNRTSQTIATGMLQLLGCQAQVAANGRVAVKAFEQGRWDVILMDCNMPEMDGYEATAVIRTLETASAQRVPIVAMTANAQAADVAKCLSAGMDDHLSKPLTLTSLRVLLQRWLPSLALVVPVPVVVDAPASRQGDAVDAAALVRCARLWAAPSGWRSGLFWKTCRFIWTRWTPAAAAGQGKAMRYTAHAVKGAAGNVGAAGLAELARDMEALAEAGQLEAAASVLGRLRAEYALVKLALERELQAEATAGVPVLDADAARVLIVDDDRSTRSTLRAALQRSGFEVSEACDGSEVADAVKRQRPDVILMDALMPVMDGFAACALLQETPEGRAIPVLMVTALEDGASIERAFAAGASDYIPKPLHLAVVNQRVRRLVEATRAAHQLQSSVQEKTALLLEIHHRVKNNLQVISSLLRLEAGRSEHAPTKGVLKDMQGRIRAMALLHETIYRKGTFAAIDLGAYIGQVASQSVRTLTSKSSTVQLRLEVSAVQVGLDQATPCGMLVSELVSNSLKHGFPPGHNGEICIELRPLDESAQWRLQVSDTGTGLTHDFETRRKNSLGLQLVNDLSMQMGGVLNIGTGPKAVFTVDFKAEKPAPIVISL
jgi:signal transduction histidine kinase